MNRYNDCRRYDDCDYRNDIGECPDDCNQFKHKDDIRVVRCRDCKYYDSVYTDCDHPRHDHQEFPVIQEPDDYCSYAERRTE